MSHTSSGRGNNLSTVPFAVTWLTSGKSEPQGVCSLHIPAHAWSVPASPAGLWCLPVLPNLGQVRHCKVFNVKSM